MAHIRRVVTGHDERGQSCVIEDGPPPRQTERLTELWRTRETPADNAAGGDPADVASGLEPPKSGSAFRILRLAVGSEPRTAEEFRRHLTSMGSGHAIVNQSRHPGMHKTDTTDYLVVLAGELTLILDKDEVVLHPLDTVVQRGTNHAWANRGNEPVLLACVNLPAKPI
jgi:mannose-6-phosphate isomerase-like protein (cupin superfamily)